MNDLKFRAWDVFNAEMIYSHKFEFLSDFWKSIERRLAGGNKVIVQFHFQVRSLEFYADDLIQTSDPMGEPTEVPIQVIKYKDGGCLIEVSTSEYDLTLIAWAIDEGYTIKVIGNIHENPELKPEKVQE